MQEPAAENVNSPVNAHPRHFAANRYVYPVLSRRAGGISIGINLNRDKICNFNCVYCQIDRNAPGEKEVIDLPRLANELDRMVALVVSGQIFDGPQFRNTPPAQRRLNDFALSGEGEPTACPSFEQAVEVCAEVRQRHGLNDVKIVLITNATLLDRPAVRRALSILDANGGEIWAKLDAGTEAYYRVVDRSVVPWRQILDNIRNTAIERPIVIQTLWARIHDEPPPSSELEAYCDRLNAIQAAGGQVKLVQIHTVARTPAESWVAALTHAEVDAIAMLVHQRTSLPTAAYYGAAK